VLTSDPQRGKRLFAQRTSPAARLLASVVLVVGYFFSYILLFIGALVAAIISVGLS